MAVRVKLDKKVRDILLEDLVKNYATVDEMAQSLGVSRQWLYTLTSKIEQGKPINSSTARKIIAYLKENGVENTNDLII